MWLLMSLNMKSYNNQDSKYAKVFIYLYNVFKYIQKLVDKSTEYV